MVVSLLWWSLAVAGAFFAGGLAEYSFFGRRRLTVALRGGVRRALAGYTQALLEVGVPQQKLRAAVERAARHRKAASPAVDHG